jgi:hypothetical protein
METTLNIHIDVLKKIEVRARERGMSRSALIIFLLKKSMDDISNPGRFGRLVKYQERGRPEDWHAFHIKMRVDDYEYLLDLRKLLKMSVSLILSRAVKKYLDRGKAGINRLWYRYKADKNRYKNYVLIQECVSDVISWRFMWGFPPDIQRYLPS